MSVDLTDPARPRVATTVSLLSTPVHLASGAGLLLATTDMPPAIQVFRVDDAGRLAWAAELRNGLRPLRTVFAGPSTAYAITAEGYGEVLDLTEPTRPQVSAELRILQTWRDIVVEGRMAYALGESGATPVCAALDIGQPAAPRLMGKLPCEGTRLGAAAGVLHVVSGRTMQWIDARDPSAMRLTSSLPLTVSHSMFDYVQSMAPLDRFAFVAGLAYVSSASPRWNWTTTSVVQLIDLSTVGAPRVLNSITPATDRADQRPWASGPGRLFRLTSMEGRFGRSIIRTYDTSTTGRPRWLADADVADRSSAAAGILPVTGLAASGELLLVMGGSRVHVFDSADPAQPRELSAMKLTDRGMGLATAGQRLYVTSLDAPDPSSSDRHLQLVIADLADRNDPDFPRPVAVCQLGSAGQDAGRVLTSNRFVFVDGGTVPVGDDARQSAEPAAPTRLLFRLVRQGDGGCEDVKTLRLPAFRNLVVKDDTLYADDTVYTMTADGGLRQVAELPMDKVFGLADLGDRLVAVGPGLVVFDVAERHAPQVIQLVRSVPAAIAGIMVDERGVYLTSGDDLIAYPLTASRRLAAPELDGLASVAWTGQLLGASGPVALVASGGGLVHQVDLAANRPRVRWSVPSTPTGFAALADSPPSMVAHNGRLCRFDWQAPLADPRRRCLSTPARPHVFAYLDNSYYGVTADGLLDIWELPFGHRSRHADVIPVGTVTRLAGGARWLVAATHPGAPNPWVAANQLALIDIGTPGATRIMWRSDPFADAIVDLKVEDRRAYVLTSRQLLIYTITENGWLDLDGATRLWARFMSLAVDRGVVYASSSIPVDSSTLVALDARQPGRIRVLAESDPFGHVQDLQINGGRVLAVGTDGITVFPLVDPDRPAPADHPLFLPYATP